MENNENDQNEKSSRMESFDRISKIPVVESTMNVAHNVYDKIKESHAIVNSVLTSAESTIKQATEAAQPITNKLEGPIKKVDSILCSSLDYVEEKIPSIKLPPEEMYQHTKEAINSNVVAPAISKVCDAADYGKQKVSSLAATYIPNETKKPEGDVKGK